MVSLFSKAPSTKPFNQFIGDISMRLLQADGAAPETVLRTIFRDIGERFGVDRVHLRWAPRDVPGHEDDAFEMVAGWQRMAGGAGKVFTATDVPWSLAKIRAGEQFWVDNLDDFPPEAAADRQAFRIRGIESALIMGLTIDTDFVGVLSMSSVKPYRWSTKVREEASTLATLVSNFYWGLNNRTKLRDSEARYRGVVQDQTDLIVRWTPDGVTNWVNERVCDYLQVPRDDLIGNTGNVLIPTADWPNLQEDVAALTPESPAKDDEWEVMLPNGERVWQEWTDRGIFDAEGTFLEIQSVGRDITERKTAEAARKREAAFQRHKAELLIELTSLKKDDADVTIRRSLEKVGHLYNAARVGVWWLSEQKNTATCIHRWFEAGVAPSFFPDTVSKSDFPWVFDQVLSGEKTVVRGADEILDDADPFKKFMEQTNTRAYLAFPFVVEGAVTGTITIAATEGPAWSNLEINELEILANILATALSRFRASETLLRHAAFQTLLAEISSSLLKVSADETNELIGEVLAIVGNHYGLDRVNVSWYEGELPGFGAPIDWAPDPSTIETPSPDEVPFGLSLMQKGEIDRIDDVEAMPEVAHIDQARWRSLGFRSVLCLPLNIKDTIFGSATFAFRSQRDWDDGTITELQLIAHTITNAALRQWSMVQISRREQDLERSQEVAKVGSYRLQATISDGDPSKFLNVLNVEMSDEAFKMFDVEPREDANALAGEAASRIHPDDELRVREMWRSSLERSGEHIVEYRIVRRDGSMIHVQVKDQLDSIDEKGVMTHFGTYKDITEWVEANRELQSAFSQIQELTDQLQDENVLLRDEVRAAHGFDKIIGNSRKLRGVFDAVRQVAPTDVTVLICGETGTGKELIAQSIHDLSDRKTMPMVSVNCAALSADLIESELFGHEKGAFTGAHARRKGRFEITNGGTLFLDEIGEMSGDLQAKLLRVIQEGEFERLGGSTTLKTDVRLVAATNRDLVQEMDSGRFRADLYYRINAFPVELPPLRERKEDIPLLAAHLVRKHAKILGKEITSMSAQMLRYLQEQDWPGNIRELEGTILRALISTTGPVLDFGGGGGTNDEAAANTSDSLSLLDAQRKHVVDVLERTRWVIEGEKGAASALGLAPSSLRSKMKRLDIVRPSREMAS